MALLSPSSPPSAGEALVNVTYDGQNGDMPNPVPAEASQEDVLAWVAEALRSGDVPGIPADPRPDLLDFVVERIPVSAAYPYVRLMVRPKADFGAV